MILRKRYEIARCIGLIGFYEGTKFPGGINEARKFIGRNYFGY